MKAGKIEDLITPSVQALGYQLWGCEFQQQSGRTLVRIYVENEAGVNVNDCAKLSRQISALFDVEDVISGGYILEVSSPGVDRTLFCLDHYRRYVGQMISVRLRIARDGTRNFKGVLQAIEDDTIVLQQDGHIEQFTFDGIEKGKLVAVF